MIHPDTMINIIDTSIPAITSTCMDPFMARYYRNTTHIGGQTILEFDGHVRIKDLQGWATLRQVIKHKIPADTEWIQIAGEGHHVIVTADHQIPVFDRNASKKGFHGRILYKYRMVPASALVSSEEVFIIKESKYMTETYDPFSVCHAERIPSSDMKPVTHAYEILTTSGFYDASDIYMRNQDFQVNEADCWN